MASARSYKGGVEPPVDVTKLSPPARRMLDPAGPAPLRKLAARAIAPGLRPAEAVTVCVLLAESGGEDAALAQATLEKLPAPLLNGALASPDLPAGVLDVLAPMYAGDIEISEKVLTHAAIAPETVERMAAKAGELVCELIAVNEARLLLNPHIIEKLYLNKSTRMSTADRLVELAVRNKLVLNLPAFEQATKAIAGELIAEPTEEATFDDLQFHDARAVAAETVLGEGEDTHFVDDDGNEIVIEKARPLYAIWGDLRAPAKIRLVQLGIEALKRTNDVEKDSQADAGAIRLLAVRDTNPLVAMAAIKSPGLQENEVLRISSMRNVSDDVLRVIATDRDWTKSYMVKLNLVCNPRTPFAFAARLIPHLRENDLKNLQRSHDVTGAVRAAAKQHLSRKH